ncbi:hypothetical protein LF41_1094 [Lysobacter dokdonensis DS-58]|uniref:MarR family transcriptional regulator n=1 Tax=Lysobacter dokdonensis DS-58 TaxID=1300345 RepID=A0A0A2WP94_9GAMM|nr:hypothetical protein [Lysobacter dokdonensis]KGQ20557.1 hypothetical protein LF41_1094 [Lysobacter dokdonensis DS-58]
MGISPDLRRFVVAKIPSVSHLEALLLLRSTSAQWPIAQLGARLYVSDQQATRLVDDLQARGLALHVGDNALYEPRSEGLARAVDELAMAYGRKLVEITQLIHSANETKARRFADAFRYRKDD